MARQAWVDGGYTQHGSTGGLPDRPAVVDLTHTYDRSGNRLTRYDGRPGARMPNWEFEYERGDSSAVPLFLQSVTLSPPPGAGGWPPGARPPGRTPRGKAGRYRCCYPARSNST